MDPFAALQDALAPQYRLERELGRGGMGVVFRATDTTLDRPVAIKVVHPELAAHPSIVRRFLAEARTIARLRHPSIVTVHAAGTAQGLLYYVMDEVEGESLRERLDREGRLPVADVIRIVTDLASALDAAGRAGVVHRDVKPENVLLERGTGRALLADFGIARAMVTDAASSTGQGVAVGTPAYMSPEQAAGEEVDSRSDLYGLGIVAYELLAGRPPFQGTNRVVVSKHIAERPVSIERVRSECPKPLAGAVMKALEKHPGERWQTGEELRQAVAGERALPAKRSSRRPLALAAAAVALAVLGTSLGLARRGDRPPDGVNPRHSILVLPFDNLRDDPTVEWMREGSVSMLGLNLAQWNDLTVVDQERLADLLGRHDVEPAEDIGLELARRLAREAGVWTVVLGDYSRVGDSLHLAARVYDVATGARISIARVDDRSGEDARPLFDQLAAQLLNLSGAPTDLPVSLARSTTQSLEAYRSYLAGVDRLNRWDLAGAERDLRRAVSI
ncbi:MAG: serine/threonine-protein kinase, partial [Chloroflexota bacterium]|nr:serine/threonine-protein kinase [Chloroflexota bacterium]